jgi:hypothetical protein
MQSLKRRIAAGLIATAGAVALPSLAFADANEFQIGGSTDFYKSMTAQYRDYIARMSPENRAKLMAMQDKMMQMEMDQKSTQMKMEMEVAKAKRDIELFILTFGRGN